MKKYVDIHTDLAGRFAFTNPYYTTDKYVLLGAHILEPSIEHNQYYLNFSVDSVNKVIHADCPQLKNSTISVMAVLMYTD